MENEYCAYKHTCPSGKCYIGITKNQVNRRWVNGEGYKRQTAFYNAILKYGWDNITHEILYTGLSKQEAEVLEIALITRYQSRDRLHGYNIAPGGIIHAQDTRTRDKIRKAHIGLKLTDAHKQKISANNGKAMLGKHWSTNARKKLLISQPARHRVLCIETGSIYESLRDAEKVTGIRRDLISKVIREINNSAGTYHWRLIV